MFKESVIKLLNRLVDKGYPTYLVGGVVRDYLLGNPSYDYDATTLATPKIIKDTYKDKCIFSYGEKFGTVAILDNEDLIEITTFRTDGAYSDNRHPEDVRFGKSLEEDVLRRDLTINALAYDIKNNQIIDLVGGIDDLNNKIVRMVGSPVDRFNEDGLRILRAIRIASKLNFIIEEVTNKAIFECMEVLDNISKERITEEIFKMFKSNFYQAFNDYFSVFNYLFKDLNKEKNNLFALKVDEDKAVIINLVFLMLNSNNPKNILEFFKCEKKIKQIAYKLYSLLGLELVNEVSSARKLMYVYGQDCIKDLAYLKKIIGKNTISEEVLNEAIRLGTTNKVLNVDGNDISLSLNCNKTKIKEYLHIAFNAVSDGIIDNDKESIINYLKGVKL